MADPTHTRAAPPRRVGKPAAGAHAMRDPAPQAALLRLQRAMGNRAVSGLLQRAAEVSPQAAAEVSPEAAAVDYAEALDYANRFYQGVYHVLEQKDKAQVEAEKNYRDFKDLKDPPALSAGIVSMLFKTVLSMVPGGNVIRTGLETGFFALEMHSFVKDLETTDNPFVEEMKPTGPSEKAKRRAEVGAESIHKGIEGGKQVYEKVKENKEKRQQAQEAEADAILLAKLGERRLTDWASVLSRVEKEQAAVVDWLHDAEAHKRRRGALLTEVKQRLGPIPTVSPEAIMALARAYELELYKRKLKERKAALVGVRYYGSEDLDPIYWYIELGGSETSHGETLQEPLKRRLIELLSKLPSDKIPGRAGDFVKRYGPDILYEDEILGWALELRNKPKWKRYGSNPGDFVHGSDDVRYRTYHDFYVDHVAGKERAAAMKKIRSSVRGY